MKKILIGARRLKIEEAVAVSRDMTQVQLDPKAIIEMQRSLAVLEDYTKNQLPVYGASTQFGSQVALVDEHTSDRAYRERIHQRQRNLVISHNIGLGEIVPIEVVRGAMLLRANCLSKGYSAVRPDLPKTLINLLNKKIHPVIRKYGSIGASGDLIPLSSIAATAMGNGSAVFYKGKETLASKALQNENITPLKLQGREGLALINGTSFMTSYALLSLYDLEYLFSVMIKTLGMSLESLLVIYSA